MQKFIGRIAAIALALGTIAVPSTVMATSAQAATYTCNDYTYGRGIGVAIKPAYESGSTETTRCYMNPGATGNEVRALQYALVKCYGRDIAVDGSYGPATTTALKYAQGKAHVAQDGYYGPATAGAIKFAFQDNVQRITC